MIYVDALIATELTLIWIRENSVMGYGLCYLTVEFITSILSTQHRFTSLG